MIYYLARLVGALVVTFLLSRLVRLGFRHRVGLTKHVAVHAVTLAIAAILGGFGMADGGDPAFGSALIGYLPAVLVWLGFDAFSDRRTRGTGATAA